MRSNISNAFVVSETPAALARTCSCGKVLAVVGDVSIGTVDLGKTDSFDSCKGACD